MGLEHTYVNGKSSLTVWKKIASEEAIAQLERENHRLGRDLGTFQNRVGRGDYDPNTTKVSQSRDISAYSSRYCI